MVEQGSEVKHDGKSRLRLPTGNRPVPARRQNVGQYVPRLGKALRAPYVEGQHFLSEEVAAARSVMRRRFDEHMRRQGL